MKHIKMIVVLFLFFHIVLANAEGFVAGTSVKVPDGYEKIEHIRVGDQVLCFDANKQYVSATVISVSKKTVDSYIRIGIANENMCVACDQQLYDEKSNSWVVASALKNGDILSGHVVEVVLINDPIDVYVLSVVQYHNFFVTKADVCVHNFFPIVVAISVAFGSGAIEIASITAGIAGLGAFLGYKWHKKSGQEHTFIIESQLYGNGMMPEDPEEEKKKKRDEAIEEYRSLIAKEAQEIAKEFGHRRVKSHPCGNTRNRPVFFNGKNYVSPDIDGHNGGLWKVFDRKGNILYTTTRRFEKIVKVYSK